MENKKLTSLEKIIKLHVNCESNSFTKALQNRDKTKLEEYFKIAREENVNLFQYQTGNYGNIKAIYKSSKKIFSKKELLDWLDYLQNNGFNILESNNLYTQYKAVDFQLKEYKSCDYISGFMGYSPYNKEDQLSYYFFLTCLIEQQKNNFLKFKDDTSFINTINRIGNKINHDYKTFEIFYSLFTDLIKNNQFLKNNIFKLNTIQLRNIFNINHYIKDSEQHLDYLLELAQHHFNNDTYDQHTINFIQNNIYNNANQNAFSEYFKKYNIPYSVLNKIVCDESEIRNYDKSLNKETINKFLSSIADYNSFINFFNKLNHLETEYNNLKISFSENFKLHPVHFRKLIEHDFLYTTNNNQNKYSFVVKDKIESLNINYKKNISSYMEVFFISCREDEIIKFSSFDRNKKTCSFDTFVYAYNNYFTEEDINKHFPKILKKYLNNEFCDMFLERDLVTQKMGYLVTKLNNENSNLFFNLIKHERELLIDTLHSLTLHDLYSFNQKINDKLLSELYSDKYIEKTLKAHTMNYNRLFKLYGNEEVLVSKIIKNDIPTETENEIKYRIQKLYQILHKSPADEVQGHVQTYFEQYALSKHLRILKEELKPAELFVKKTKRL